MISVCLASYNGERFIRPQIESILHQLGPKDELVISDDGSTDSTILIINSYADPRIKLLHNKNRHGVNGNFENALRNASGDFIFLADQDDVWLPGKIVKCIEALQNADCVVHNAYLVDINLRHHNHNFFDSVNAKKGLIHNWIHNGYLGCAMAFRKEVLELALPIPDHATMYHDVWIGNIAAVKHRVEFIDFIGILFRRHENSTSITFHNRLSFVNIIKNRLSVAFLIAKRLLKKRKKKE